MNVNLPDDPDKFLQTILNDYTLRVYAYTSETGNCKTAEDEFLGLHFNFKSDFNCALPAGAIGKGCFNMIYVPPGTPCYTAPGDFLSVTIHFKKSFLTRLVQYFPSLTFFLDMIEDGKPVQMAGMHPVTGGHIVDSLEDLFTRINEFPGKTREMYIAIKTAQITLLALDQLVTDFYHTRCDPAKIMEAREYLLEHIGVRKPIRIVTAATGLTRWQLTQGFKELFHTSVNDFIKNERAKKARVLLRDTYMPLSGVGAAIGYPLMPGFVRFFKRMTGTTPGAFRRKAGS